MSQQVKAAYYPRIIYTMTMTPFGALESDYPSLYCKKIDGHPDLQVCEIDTLEVVKDVWGSNILQARKLTYELLSGSCNDETLRKLLISFTQKYVAFSNYVTDVAFFGELSVPLIQRIVHPMRDKIDKYESLLEETLKLRGAKILMRTHDYLYVSFRSNEAVNLTDIKGVRMINV